MIMKGVLKQFYILHCLNMYLVFSCFLKINKYITGEPGFDDHADRWWPSAKKINQKYIVKNLSFTLGIS